MSLHITNAGSATSVPSTTSRQLPKALLGQSKGGHARNSLIKILHTTRMAGGGLESETSWSPGTMHAFPSQALQGQMTRNEFGPCSYGRAVRSWGEGQRALASISPSLAFSWPSSASLLGPLIHFISKHSILSDLWSSLIQHLLLNCSSSSL